METYSELMYGLFEGTRHHSNHVIVFLPLKKIKAQWRTGKKIAESDVSVPQKSCSFKIVNKSAPALI